MAAARFPARTRPRSTRSPPMPRAIWPRMWSPRGWRIAVRSSLSYAIGVAKPLSIHADTYGTGEVPEAEIERAVAQAMDLTPKGHPRASRPQPPDLSAHRRLWSFRPCAGGGWGILVGAHGSGRYAARRGLRRRWGNAPAALVALLWPGCWRLARRPTRATGSRYRARHCAMTEAAPGGPRDHPGRYRLSAQDAARPARYRHADPQQYRRGLLCRARNGADCRRCRDRHRDRPANVRARAR